MNKVFLSYSRKNKKFVERLARDLSDAGLEVWVDFRQIHAGEFWQEEIYRGIERADIVVLCLSPDSVVSEWVQREVNTARDQGKAVIPVMVTDAYATLEKTDVMRWILDIHFILFENRYEEAFPELLAALPGKRRVGAYDVVDVDKIPNPFKGLEAFQQTDSHFFFGRESLIRKSLLRLKRDRPTRFLAVVGASGSGKSSLVRAGILPELRGGVLPGSDQWSMAIFTPGNSPIDALAQRLSPLVEDRTSADIAALLEESPEHFDVLVEQILAHSPPEALLLLVVDQFEEVFTRAGEADRAPFLNVIHHAITAPKGRALVLITMRADFFDHLSHYPKLAELFEQENMVIVTEMTASELLRSIEGPATAVGLVYDDGLPQRVLEDVRRQPGSLPLLQYALKQLYLYREGNRLTTAAYEAIGGVQKALAGHAEAIYSALGAAEQGIMRRVLLQLVEVSASGESTRRKVNRNDLRFRDVPDAAVQKLIDDLTAAESRLLIASRQISASDDEQSEPIVWLEVGHEALIRQWERFTGWVAEDQESLRYGTEIMQAAHDWRASNRDKAYLLVGNRLIRAEAWLQDADATELQREFVQASMIEGDRQFQLRQQQMERELELQRRAANRLRGLIVLMFAAMVVAGILATWAMDSQKQAQSALSREQQALLTAIANEQLAIANEQQAVSLALASGANTAFADNNRDRAVMLAIFANDMENPPAISQRTLADLVYTPGTRFLIQEDGAAITDAAFSPDGTLAVFTVGNRLVLRDGMTGEFIRQLIPNTGDGYTTSAAFRYVVFSPDAALIASARDDGATLLWDISAGTEIRQFLPPTSYGASRRVNSIAFDPTGASLVSGWDDGTVILWRVSDGLILRNFRAHDLSVNDVAFSPDGQTILTASDDDTAKLWTLYGVATQTLTGHTADVNCLAFSSDGAFILTGSDDDTVRRWRVETGDEMRVYQQHEGNINRVAFSPDDSTLVSASSDGTVVWWMTSSGQVLDVFSEHAGTVWDVGFSPDGQYMLSTSSDGTARLWDVRDVERQQQYVGHGSSSDSLNRAVVGVYSDDGRMVLSGGADSTLRLWDAATGLTIQQFLGHTGIVTDVALSAASLTALSASSDQSVILWDVAGGTARFTLTGHGATVNAVAYLPGDTQAVSGGAEGGLILWDLQTGEILRRYGPAVAKGDIGHTGAVYDVAVSPDGARMLSASADGNLLLWDIATGAVIRQYKGHNDEIRAVAFDPTGNRAVSGAANGTLIFWDVSDGATVFGGIERRILDAHDRAILSVAYAPSGATAISGAQDNTLRLWDVATGFELRRYSTRSKLVFHSVDFRSDGSAVLSGISDATLQEWRILTSPKDLIAWALAHRYVREPTCEERELFGLTPFCVDGMPTPTRTPVVFPTATATPERAALLVGYTATINTSDGDTLNVRANPGITARVVIQLEDDTVVTLLEGPLDADGYTWWRIQTADGTQGWVVESIPEEGLQTLLP